MILFYLHVNFDQRTHIELIKYGKWKLKHAWLICENQWDLFLHGNVRWAKSQN